MRKEAQKKTSIRFTHVALARRISTLKKWLPIPSLPIPTKYQTRLKCLRDSGLAVKKPEVFGEIRWDSIRYICRALSFLSKLSDFRKYFNTHSAFEKPFKKSWRQNLPPKQSRIYTRSEPPTPPKEISLFIQGIESKIRTFIDLHLPNFPSGPIFGWLFPPTFAGSSRAGMSFWANKNFAKLPLWIRTNRSFGFSTASNLNYIPANTSINFGGNETNIK